MIDEVNPLDRAIPRSLFWDIDLNNVDPADYPVYAVERVLEFGDRVAADWLRNTFSEALITGVLRRSRRLSARSANFWALVFEVPRHQVTALTGVNAR